MRGYPIISAYVLLGVVTTAMPARAQVPDSILQRNECRLAHQVLTLGQPADRREWALDVIDRCGDLGGEAIASLIREYRNVSQPGGELEQVVRRTRYLVSPMIFDAAWEVAMDAGAGTVARVQSIRILLTQLSPGTLAPYESFRDNNSALIGGTHTEAALWSEPLPEEAYTTTESRLRDLLDDGATPSPVRNAADQLLPGVLMHLYCRRDMRMDECLEIVKKRLAGG